MENNTLNHHGIKGMRWGIRRFQNKDGSLTPAGQKRRDQQDDKKPKADEKKAEAPKKKSLSDMSDDEINKAISRAQLEDRYKALRPDVGGKVPKRKNVGDMTNEELREALDRARMEDQYRALRPEKESAIKTLLSTTFKDVIAPAAIRSGERFLEKYMDKMGDELLKDTEDPNSISSLKKLKEKLQLKKDIDDLKNPKEKELSWDDKIKKQTWEENERKARKAEAEENDPFSNANLSKKRDRLKLQNEMFDLHQQQRDNTDSLSEKNQLRDKARFDARKLRMDSYEKLEDKFEETRARNQAKANKRVRDQIDYEEWKENEARKNGERTPKSDATYKTPYDRKTYVDADPSATGMTVSKTSNSSKSPVIGLLESWSSSSSTSGTSSSTGSNPVNNGKSPIDLDASGWYDKTPSNSTKSYVDNLLDRL